jgi:hypothetical protein
MAGLGDIADELESVARHLRLAGEEDLARELTAAMRRGVRPVLDDIRAGLKPHLPDRYAAELDADLRLGVNVRTTGSDPGVSVTAQTRSGKNRSLRRLDAGLLRHPLFGDDEHWYAQEGADKGMEPGFFTGPCEARELPVRAELEKALDDVGAKAAGKGI